MTSVRPHLLLVTSQDTAVALQLVRALLASDAHARVQVLFERQPRTWRQRLRAQWRHLRRNGPMWVPYRVGAFVRERFARRGHAAPTLLDALDDLRRAFPDRFSARVVPNVHDAAVLAELKETAADLGIVFGTRILQPKLFTIPRLGMVNIHQGKLPDYRGMPPGFWELYNGEPSAGVTVHQVAAALDAGHILCQATVDIRPFETVESLQSRLDAAVLENIGAWIALVLSNQVRPQPQRPTEGKLYTAPTVYERLELRRRLRGRG